MAKKKKKSKSSGESAGASESAGAIKSKGNSKGSKLPIIIGVVVALMIGGYFVTQSSSRGGVSEQAGYGESEVGAIVPVTAGLIETRPIMAPNNFRGRVSAVYKWAAEIPEVFDALYCYCRCKENPRFKHKTLLTCYTDTHASKCGICMKEGQMAWELTKKGMTITEIRSEVDKYYARLNRSRVF